MTDEELCVRLEGIYDLSVPDGASCVQAATARIRVLRKTIDELMPITCDELHHEPADYHELLADCPIIKRARAELSDGGKDE